MQELQFTDADVRTAGELEQQLQTAVQQLIRNRYSSSNRSSSNVAGSSWAAAGLGSESTANEELVQCIAFAEEPLSGVYEVLGLYEEVRCTSTWYSLAVPWRLREDARDHETLLMRQGSSKNAHACSPPAFLTVKQHLEDALLAAISAALPGRQMQGIVFHFNELNPYKLFDQLLHAQVFGALPLHPPAAGSCRSAVSSRVGCLVVRLFAFPCGLYSGWLFAGAID